MTEHTADPDEGRRLPSCLRRWCGNGSSDVVTRRTWDDAVSGGGEARTIERVITLPSSFWAGLERGRPGLLGTQGELGVVLTQMISFYNIFLFICNYGQ